MKPNAIILFAHGSRDPLWRAPMEAVAMRIRTSGLRVQCAYLELCEPDLPTVANSFATELIALHADSMRADALKSSENPAKKPLIRIVPMFLGMGKHAREDLPELATQLRAAHPQIDFEIATTVGEDERVTALLAQIASA
jgi:sirohydrochlorin cobaltochelatase